MTFIESFMWVAFATCVIFGFPFLIWMSLKNTFNCTIFEIGLVSNLFLFFVFITHGIANIDHTDVPKKVPQEPTPWEDCVKDIKWLVDNVNDTVGASYALVDKPTSELKGLIDFCLENK